MKKHVFIIALIWLLVGIGVGSMFIVGHVYFFSISSTLFLESSVLDENLSVLRRWRENFDIYLDFFGKYGINPLISLFNIISSIALGYGLLRRKEWARKLGFLIMAFTMASSIYGMIEGRVSMSIILQIMLCGYMWWVFTSPETIRLMKGEI